MRIRALIFDTTDTLWQHTLSSSAERERVAVARAIAKLLDGWGIASVDPAALAAALTAAIHEAENEARRSLLAPDYLLHVERAAAAAGLLLSPDDLDLLWRAGYIDPERLGRQTFPDTIATLRWVREAGYLLAVIDDSPHAEHFLAAELANAGLAGLFDAVTGAYRSGWLRPHPRAFLDVLGRLGVEPGEAMVIGDSLTADIHGARLLGMRTVWKRNGRRLPAGQRPTVMPTYQIDDLCELCDLPELRRERPSFAPSRLLPSETPDPTTGTVTRPDRYD